MYFLDTNVFVRFLLDDDPQKAAACRTLFESIRLGKVLAFTSESVLSEIAYVITAPRTYGVSPTDLVARLRPLVQLEGLHLSNKRVCVRALDIYAQYPFLGFEDALHLAYIEGEELEAICSYDRDFDRIPGTVRIEP